MKIYRLLLLLSSWAHKLTALNVAILLTCLIAVALVGYAVYLCRKEEKGLKLAACLMLWIGAVSLCAFQTHTFPALDTNNSFTGSNTFSGNVTATAGQNQINLYSLNGMLYYDGVKYTTAQQVVNALAVSGNQINFPCGTFGTMQIPSSVSNVTIQGAGRCTIFTSTVAGSLITQGGNCTIPNSCAVIWVQANGVTLRDFQMQGQAPDGTTSYRAIEIASNVLGTRVERLYWTGTTVSNGFNVWVYFDPNSANFVVAFNEGHQIVGVNSGSGYGVAVQNAGPGNLEGNHSFFDLAGNGRHHFYISQGSTYVRVLGNYMVGGQNDMLEFYALDAQPVDQFNEAIDNILVNPNVAPPNGMIAIINHEQGIKIIGNILIQAVQSNGIAIYDGGSGVSTTPFDSTIEDNTIKSAGNCISVLGASGNYFRHNHCIGTGSGASNTFTGIQIQSDNPLPANNNVLQGNDLISATQRYALSITGTPAPTGTILTGGNILGDGATGLTSEAASTTTVFDGNIFQGVSGHINTVSTTTWGCNLINNVETCGIPGVNTGTVSLLGGFKAGASGTTISDTRELIQNAHSCGTTTTCANTTNGSNRIVFGQVNLTSATPSTATITGISPAFTGSGTYFCTLGGESTQANSYKWAPVSSSSFTITGPNTVTDLVSYACVGN